MREQGAAWQASYTLVAGCPAPSSFGFIHTAPEATADGPSSTGDSPLPTTGATATTGGPIATTTTGAPTGRSSGAPETSGTSSGGSRGSTGEPAGPPTIESVVFEPDPIEAAGPVTVTVKTTDADGVSMKGLGDAPIELAPQRPQVFGDDTSIAVVSSQANGARCATFTPWRAGMAEMFWEGTPVKGAGSVAALATLPDGQVVEFGTPGRWTPTIRASWRRCTR